MIAAERDQVPKRSRLRLDLGESAFDIAVGDPDIPDIGDIEVLHVGPRGRVIAVDEHAARLADCRRPEPRSGPV